MITKKFLLNRTSHTISCFRIFCVVYLFSLAEMYFKLSLLNSTFFRNLLMGRGRKPTSAVWTYVQKVGVGKSICLVEECEQSEIGSDKAANCKDHLRIYHRAIYDEVQAEDAKFKNDHFLANFGSNCSKVFVSSSNFCID